MLESLVRKHVGYTLESLQRVREIFVVMSVIQITWKMRGKDMSRDMKKYHEI